MPFIALPQMHHFWTPYNPPNHHSRIHYVWIRVSLRVEKNLLNALCVQCISQNEPDRACDVLTRLAICFALLFHCFTANTLVPHTFVQLLLVYIRSCLKFVLTWYSRHVNSFISSFKTFANERSSRICYSCRRSSERSFALFAFNTYRFTPLSAFALPLQVLLFLQCFKSFLCLLLFCRNVECDFEEYIVRIDLNICLLFFFHINILYKCISRYFYM